MLAKAWNDFSMPTRKHSCRSSSCASACLRCASGNRRFVLSCKRSLTRPTIGQPSCDWRRLSRRSSPACAVLLRRLMSQSASESYGSWSKTFWWGTTPSPFATASQSHLAPHKTAVCRQVGQTAKVTFCVRGVVSPALANCALDGLEPLLQEKYPAKRRLKSLGGSYPCMNVIRYADDFVVTSKSKDLLEGEVQPLVEQFLQQRGLKLSPTKTVTTHVEKGFDFLGQNVRRYPNGKLLIKPSKKNVKTFLAGVRATIKAGLGLSAADLIDQLNPKIRGWVNYHRHVVAKRTFSHVDHSIFHCLRRWARRRHPKKSSAWLREKYYERSRRHNRCFFGD